MAVFIIGNPLVFTFGILGNVVALMVYLAPAATFYNICKKKTTGGFHSVPYIIALLSCVLWIYYATLKENEILLITINSIGCFIESIYIFIYIFYAPKLARVLAVKMLLIVNVVGFGLILVFMQLLVKGSRRVEVLGWISVVLSISVYISPLSIMHRVIRTKSVEYMPISLTVALLLNAIMWFFYGLLLKDFFIAVPNVVGLLFGVVQIILYFIYKNSKESSESSSDQKLPVTAATCEIHPVCSLPALHDDDDDNQNTENNLDNINIVASAEEINNNNNIITNGGIPQEPTFKIDSNV